jgi:hypothetical protein
MGLGIGLLGVGWASGHKALGRSGRALGLVIGVGLGYAEGWSLERYGLSIRGGILGHARHGLAVAGTGWTGHWTRTGLSSGTGHWTRTRLSSGTGHWTWLSGWV